MGGECPHREAVQPMRAKPQHGRIGPVAALTISERTIQ
ncbi:hypothetical protein SJ05684_c01430 [Sinorhizobium sojae CCBAU 05684]|uniref:Uncharacterized protein n=1 Tax=Sinorhizobium sojae CCBAU 05684 TaxID=716928 RepID=A0A249P6P6_9HYPH|nr:hypothetical protein SJ05684_c01430 [Sinorhizobium sojae CCBAU 05684]